MTEYGRPGDIGLTSISGDVGRLIRIAQWADGTGFSPYEHAFVVVDDGKIVEAEPGGARIADLSEYQTRDLAWLSCPDEFREGVVAAAMGFVGTPYNFIDYAVIALRHFHVPIPGLAHRARSTRAMICSQLAVESARAGKWHLCGDMPAGYVDPGMLWSLGAVRSPARPAVAVPSSAGPAGVIADQSTNLARQTA
jgi:hypothetical protein